MLAAVKPLRSSADYGSSKGCAIDPTGQATILVPSVPTAAVSNDQQSLAHPTIENLFEQHNQQVFRTAYRVTGSTADAEDVLQTVFLRVARGPETVTTAENAQAYFSRAAVNASLDLLRSRKRSRAVAIDDVIEGEASVVPFVRRDNPERHQEDRELRSLIRQAVSELGNTAGQMFALRYFEGYGNGEIAQMMNTSALVVGVTLHRARARLRKEIGRYLHA